MDAQKTDILSTVYAFAVLSFVAMMVAAVPVGYYTVFFARLSTQFSYQTVIAYGSPPVASVPFYVGLLTIYLPITATYGDIFAILTALVAVFIAVAALQGGGIVKAMRDVPRQGMRALFANPLLATVIILGASLLATVLLDFVQTSAGVSTGGLSGDPLQLLISFALAPFIEEIGYRFFLIGVPLFIVLIALRNPLGRSLKALWRPSSAWDAAPVDEQARSLQQSHKLLVYLLIALSSVVFGLAHYLAGSGWGIGKISEAALDGVALAYLYVRYGLHTSIIYHWATDVALNIFAFYGQAVYGVSWLANTDYSLLPEYDILFIVGIPGALYIVYRMVTWYSTRTRPHQVETVEPATPLQS